MTATTPVAAENASAAASVRSLRVPVAVFAIGLAIHGIDHMFVRGMMASPPSIMVGGTLQMILVAATLVLIWRGWPRSPELGVVAATVSVVGFGYAHLMPSWWPAFSDSFVTGPRIGVSWFSWVTVVAEMGTAIVFGIAAARVVRARRRA